MAKRLWRYKAEDSSKWLYRGGDEYGRNTIAVRLPWVGTLVFAYWTCYCPTCAHSRSIVRADDIMEVLGLDPWDEKNEQILQEIMEWDSDNRRALAKAPKKPKPDKPGKRCVGYAYFPGNVEPGVSFRKALVGYNRVGDYEVLDDEHFEDDLPGPLVGNLILSKDRDTKQHLPIIDLDYSHRYIPSSTPGHGHLYLNRPISRWRWYALMIGLRIGRVIEPGNFWWSLRRGENCTRSEPLMKATVKAHNVDMPGLGRTTHLTIDGVDDLLVIVSRNTARRDWSWGLYEFVENDEGFREWKLVRSGDVLKKSAAVTVAKKILTDYAVSTRVPL